MSESEYRSLQGLNASRFKAFVRSPFHFKHQKEVETTEAMRVGTAIHTAILEPEEYFATIAYLPDIDGRTKEGKILKAEFEEKNVGKTILKADSQEIVERCCKAVVACMKANADKFSSGIRKEVVVLGSLFKIDCKAKLDIVDVERGVITDIKSCQDAMKFRYDVQDRLYWVQAGFYCLMAEMMWGKPFSFQFIAVETTEPSGAVLYTVTDEELQIWKNCVTRDLARYMICDTINEWEGYSPSKTLPALSQSIYS